MDEFDVDYASMQDNIRRLSELLIKLNEEIAGIADYTQNLDIFWDGDANSAYMTAVSDDLAYAAAFLLRIRQTVSAADKVFSVYMENEERVRGMVSEYTARRR